MKGRRDGEDGRGLEAGVGRERSVLLQKVVV